MLARFLKASTTKPITIGTETFHVKPWTLNDKKRFNEKIDALRDDEHRDEHAVRLLLSECLCDEKGQMAYPDPSKIEVEEIPGDVLDALIVHCKKVQQFGDESPND